MTQTNNRKIADYEQAFTQDTYEDFNTRLTGQFSAFISSLMAGGFDSDGIPRMGHELESQMIDENHRLSRLRQKIPIVSIPNYSNQPQLMDAFGILKEEIARNHVPVSISGELGGYTYEINTDAKALRGTPFSTEESELISQIGLVDQVLARFGARSYLTGTPETSTPVDCSPDAMVKHPTKATRYKGIDHGVLSFRHEPIDISIKNGRTAYSAQFRTIMPEALCTSFQTHMQMARPYTDGHRYINASAILAGPVLAVASNSPFVNEVGPLWKESRIPLFEQSIDSRSPTERKFGSDPGRGSFPTHYYTELLDFFLESFKRPALLPDIEFGKGGAIAYPLMRLQVGTDWRWIRPAWHKKEGDPDLALTLEFRPIPAGPTIRDMLANSALYIGAMHYLTNSDRLDEIVGETPFQDVRNNFYKAAKYGMEASFTWNGMPGQHAVDVLSEIVEYSKAGLASLGIAPAEIRQYMAPIERRIAAIKSPADWKIDIYNRAMGQGASQHDALCRIVDASIDHLENNEPVI